MGVVVALNGAALIGVDLPGDELDSSGSDFQTAGDGCHAPSGDAGDDAAKSMSSGSLNLPAARGFGSCSCGEPKSR